MCLSRLLEPTKAEILTKSRGVDGILCATHESLNAKALDRAGQQSDTISTKSAGTDCVDVTEMKHRGIPLGHTANVLNDDAVAAGLDVTVPKPLPANDELIKVPNCAAVPHLGSVTIKTRENMAILSAQNVINGIEGKSLIYSN